MDNKKILNIMRQAGLLKTTFRHCFTAPDRRESVAEHSWRVALFAMLMSHEEEFENLDMNRVIKMCLIHDLGESFTGDIPSFRKTSGDRKKENTIFRDWIDSFPEPLRGEWMELFEEMEALKTSESRLCKALDKMEAVVAHDESDISTWLPLEYDLQLTYGEENVAFSPRMKNLKAKIDEWTREKIQDA